MAGIPFNRFAKSAFLATVLRSESNADLKKYKHTNGTCNYGIICDLVMVTVDKNQINDFRA